MQARGCFILTQKTKGQEETIKEVCQGKGRASHVTAKYDTKFARNGDESASRGHGASFN